MASGSRRCLCSRKLAIQQGSEVPQVPGFQGCVQTEAMTAG